MKRLNLIYGGQTYSIGRRELDEFQDAISAGLRSGEPYWLTVNSGAGVWREARLLITPGVDLALLPVPDGDTDPDLTTDEPVPPRAR